MEKVDRRVRRTRALLGQALRDLITAKPYETITIQDITDQADLNRATFYLHYASKEELLMDSLEQEFDNLVAQMESEKNGRPFWEDPATVRLIFEYVAANADLFKVLLGSQGQGYVMYRIIHYIAQVEMEELQSAFGAETLPIPHDILARHFAGALFALVSWWLEEGMPYSPTYMAETIQQLCMVGFMPVLAEVQAN
ncbi:MAG TPA: TetR/AcrR family transcriptional regulator [Chloroflexota bacterium]|nr:TetR/AcrR family transcriptional regulator [Chloroflexota bacterium]HUM71148.1 TetR/AcrR family transcriptional regulator [Chloroflexota bacterium]